MAYQLAFLPEADEDIEEILAWTRTHFGADQMVRYAESIGLALDELESDAFTPKSRSHPELDPAARIMHLSRPGKDASHFIIYRVDEEAGIVEIGRLLHDSMDLRRQLRDAYRP